jgi:outer membrane protein OmpA-like peptidoglycan-associated protein/uncharacterized protein YidB (DUF937 family)
MASFDNLTREIHTRYCLGPKARPLVQETVRLVSQQPGGLLSLVQRFKAAGFAVEVASWLEGLEPIPLSGQEVEQALGSDAISSIAAKIGMSQSFTRTILGYAIPNVVAALAKGGAIATAFRALASQVFAPAGRGLPSSLEEEMRDGAQRIRPSVPHDGRAAPVLAGLIIPAITLLIVLGSLLGYFIGAGGRGPTRPPAIVVQEAPVAPKQAASMPSPAPLGVATSASAPVMVAGATKAAPPLVLSWGEKRQDGTPNRPAPEFPAIHFATNRAMPVTGSWPLVEKAARLIKQLPPGTVVEIGGYTDNVGSAAANMGLSQRRANAVREALIWAGVHSTNLTAKGYGSSGALALPGQNETVEGRSNALAGDRGRNDRRVEFRVRRY